uniref:Uncharacterized protein n=1 Tax=Lactuca sativa TaxID=4236 RepID=A0A9R1WLI0_LACSA|nr:hypothetical protein LSAT_V11C100045020 [Lactuca sativa]
MEFEDNHGKKDVDTGDEHQPKGDVDPVDDYEDEYSGSKESVSEGPWSEGSRSEGNMTDDESEDEDFFVDLENIVDDVDVDMKEFHMHVDEDVEWKPKGIYILKKMTKQGLGLSVEGGVVPDMSGGPWTKSRTGFKDKTVNMKEGKCPWVVLMSRPKETDDWVVNTLVSEHRCVQSRTIKA